MHGIAKNITISLIISIVLTSFALAGPPPRTPSGFTWKEVPSIKAYLLVPDGWYFKEMTHGKTKGIFITEEKISPTKNYETGLSFNAFIGNQSGQSKVVNLFEQAASKYSIKVSKNILGGFTTMYCNFLSTSNPDGEKEFIAMHGFINNKTGTSYIATFKSPASEMNKKWLKGRVLIDEGIAINSKL